MRLTDAGMQRSREEAERLRNRLRAEGYDVDVQVLRDGRYCCRVMTAARPEEWEDERP